MPVTLILQDLITVTSPTNAAYIQPADEYLDLSGFQDIYVYPFFTGSSGSPILAIQTAPVKEDEAFASYVLYSWTAPSYGWQSPQGFHMSSSNGFAQYLRWAVTTASSGWDITFRLLLAANPIV